MAEVGILNLQIKDNSEEAAKGLIDLGNAFLVLKNAVGEGIRLSGVATQIKRLAKVVDESMGSGTIATIERFCNSISKLNGLGNISINLKGAEKISQTIESIEAGKAAVQGMAEGFSKLGERISRTNGEAERFNNAVRETNELMRNTTWSWGSGGFEQFQQMLDVLFRARSMALGAGDPFASWKEGAIEVEGTVKDASEGISGYLGEPIKYLTDTASQLGGINEYLEKTDTLFEKLAQDTAGASGAYAIIPYGTKSVADDIRDMANASKPLKDNMEDVSKAIMQAHALKYRQIPQTFEDVYNGIYNGKKVQGDLTSAWLHGQGTPNEQLYALKTIAEQFGMTIDEAREKIESLRAAEQGMESATGGVRSGLARLADALGLTGKSFSEVMIGADGLNGAFQRMFPTISGLLKRFSSLIKYRMLRAIIKQISEGFREGYENYYHYSEAIGGSFAPAMDSAASALLQMKNSIGAAIAPLMQSLVPVLQTVVNWFITAVNWANQFIALLRGQSTWSRAVPTTTKAFEKTGKAAKSASSAMKDLLADWDELNIIQSQGGGGSGGAATGDYLKDYASMFEEVGEFNDDIKRLVRGLKQQFGSILDFAKEIGIAVLGWKLSEGFTGIIGALGGLIATGAIIDLVFKASTIFNGNYMQTGKTGWLIADILTTFLGASLAKKALGKVLGGSLVPIGVPLVLTFSAIAGIKSILGDVDTDALSKETLVAGIENSLKVGGAAGYLLFKFGEVGFAGSVGAGLGVAITTLGVIVGLKAIADTIDTRQINRDTIKANLISAGLVGAGLAITEAILGGTAATIIGVGASGALLTLGALFAIEGIIALTDKEEKVHWGDYKATKEEIESFVNNELFETSPQVTISLVNATIESLGEKKADLEAKAETTLGTLYAVKLGLKSKTMDDVMTEVNDLITSYNETTKTAQDALEVAVSLVPVTDENGNDLSADIIKNSSGRWNELNGIMGQLGEELAGALEVKYSETSDQKAKEMADKTIDRITNMMRYITEAISFGEAKAGVMHALNLQIENLTKDSMDDLYDYFKQQQELLIDELVKASEAGAQGLLSQQYAFEKLAEYRLQEVGGDTTDATYQDYITKAKQAQTDYENTMHDLRKRTEEQVNKEFLNPETSKKIRDSMLGFIEKPLSEMEEDFGTMLDKGADPQGYIDYLKSIFAADNASTALTEEFGNLFEAVISNVVGAENFDTYKQWLDVGVLKYADFIDNEFIKGMASELSKRMTGDDRLAGVLEAMLGQALSGGKITISNQDEIVEQIGEATNSAISGKTVGIDEVNAEVGKLNVKADWDEATLQMREKVKEALNHGSISDSTEIDLIDQIGEKQYNAILEDLGFNLDGMEMKVDGFTIQTDWKTVAEEFYKDLISALDDNKPNSLNEIELKEKYGEGTYRKMLDFYNANLVDDGYSTSGFAPMGMRAAAQSMNISDVGTAGRKYIPDGSVTLQVEPGDNQQEVNNTANGVRQGTETLLSALNSILSVAQAINRKQFVVNLVPTSGLGRTVAQGAAAFSRVTGVDR